MKKFTSLVIGAAILSSPTGHAEVPTLALTFGTNVFISNGTTTQRSKIDKAEIKLREIIQTPEFRSRVLNFTYNGSKRFVDNGGLTNSQIYYKILKAAEVLIPTVDNELDLKVKTYYQNSNTVGYTYPSSLYINMNTKYLNNYTIAQTAKTLAHEWLHKMGFKHAVTYSISRDYSVPYGIGRIVQDLATKI